MSQYPFPVEPMGIGTILDRTFKTYVKKFSSFALFTLLVQGLYTLVFFILEQVNITSTSFDIASLTELFDRSFDDLSEMQNFVNRLNEISDSARAPAWISILSFAASLFVTPIVAGGIAYVTTGHFIGEQHTPGKWFSLVLSKYKTLFVTHVCSVLFLIGIFIMLAIASVFIFVLFGILTAVAPFLGILLIIAGIAAIFIIAMFLAGVFMMVYPIAIREEISGFAPAIRAFRIGFMSFWKTIGIVFLAGLIVLLASLIVSYILETIVKLAFPSVLFIAPLIGVILGWFLDPITNIAMNMNYLSVRIQKEGYLAEPDASAEDLVPDLQETASSDVIIAGENEASDEASASTEAGTMPAASDGEDNPQDPDDRDPPKGPELL